MSSDSEKVNVRSIISIFENQTYSEPTVLVRRAKSMTNLSYSKPIVRKVAERIEPEKNLELTQIEQQIQHLQNKVSNNYITYSRDNHIYYQNQIIFVLTDLANVETRSNPRTIEKKSELTEVLKRLVKKLNTLLPSSEEIVTKTVTAKYDKFGNRSSSVDEEREEIKKKKKKTRDVKKQRSEEKKIQRREAREEHVIEKEVVVVVQQREPKEDEVDSPSVSVKNLKQIFEQNTNENEGKVEFGVTKISRKFLTFNSSSDLKYVPFSERFKGRELNGKDSSIEKRDSFDDDASDEYFNTVLKITPASDDETGEEKEGELTPDSLSNPEGSRGHSGSSSSSSSSSEGSESEKTAKEDIDDE